MAEADNLIAERYSPEGYFPLVLVLNADGKVLGKKGTITFPLKLSNLNL